MMAAVNGRQKNKKKSCSFDLITFFITFTVMAAIHWRKKNKKNKCSGFI